MPAATNRTQVTVEEVEDRRTLRRFADMDFVAAAGDARWSPGVRVHDEWRLDRRRHPYLGENDHAFLLARRLGRPVGRIAPHIAAGSIGRFGAFAAVDDFDVVRALLDAARAWLGERGVDRMEGPYTWDHTETAGVLTVGNELPGVTGAAWMPARYHHQLRRAGGASAATHDLYLLTARDLPAVVEPLTPDEGAERPPVAGGYADGRLIGASVAAVPDVAGLLRRTSVRSAWRSARSARQGRFPLAVCVRCDGDPDVVVPGLLRVCLDAGYTELLAPWAPDGRAPSRRYETFRFT